MQCAFIFRNMYQLPASRLCHQIDTTIEVNMQATTTADPAQHSVARDMKSAAVRLNAHTWRRFLIAALIAMGAATFFMTLPDVPMAARLSLTVFSLAIVGWTVLDLDEMPVALAAAMALVLAGVIGPTAFYAALGSDLIWLLVGGFILAAAITQSGLAERFARKLTARAANVNQLLSRVAWLTAMTAFIVPSTSARAALLLPVFIGLAAALGQPRLTRALALLFPTVILLSACGSLLGAGAHLIAVDFMRRLDGDAPGYVRWLYLVAPFAAVSSYMATKAVAWMFLTNAERRAPIALPAMADLPPMSVQQRNLVFICLATLAAWVLGDVHGVDAALVAIAGALLATTRAVTGIEVKAAIKKVEWNLILFLAGTLVLGAALQSSGAADAMAKKMLAILPANGLHEYAVLIFCATVALVSHTFITSRTVRTTILIPAVAIPLASGGINASLLIFVVTVGSGFCQTFVVSAKPVAIFAKTDMPTFTAGDLIKLSSVLLVPLLLLLLLFSAVIWPVQGLR
jgi:solute carrier family 13 (sodium-dependent dicarboxylate transporter), member 2/3/5